MRHLLSSAFVDFVRGRLHPRTIRGVPACLALACLLVTPASYAHDNGAYSHDSNQKTSNENWMAILPEDVRLSELSIPGTHDTMSHIGGDAVQTQSMSLDAQLKSGIRALDIRCWHTANAFAINHGFVFQGVFFTDVLNTVVGFLKAHPTETVYMRVKEEFSPQLNTRSFEATFQSYWNDGRWKDYFWQPGSDNNPTLGSTRGKLVVLQNFDGGKYGIPYSGLDGQDEYNLGTNWDLYWKWEKVRDHLSKANGGPWDTKYINYLSGSGGVFPYFVASGHSSPGTGAPRLATGRTTPGWNSSYPDFPRVDCFIGICTIAFEGTNILTSDRLINYRRVGIIMADFPGPDLINNVIRMTQKQNTRSISFWKGQLPARNGELRDCLGPDQSAFIADNGWYKLAWQGDGNLVMYDREGKPRWASGTNGPDTTGLCFQSDGNLVIYGRSGPKWATGTNPGGNELRFQTDCNLVIYDSTGNPKWHTNTYPCR